MVNVQSGFETTGVYPLDRSKIMPPEYLEESVLEEDVDGLPFLPLLTPSRKSYSRKETDVPRKETDASRNYTYPTAGRPLKEILTYPEPSFQQSSRERHLEWQHLQKKDKKWN